MVNPRARAAGCRQRPGSRRQRQQREREVRTYDAAYGKTARDSPFDVYLPADPASGPRKGELKELAKLLELTGTATSKGANRRSAHAAQSHPGGSAAGHVPDCHVLALRPACDGNGTL